MNENFKKPQLLSNDEYDLNDLDYSSMFISKKRDGVRSQITNEGLFGRSLKKLRNINIQNFFKEIWSKLPDSIILEAEIYADNLPCREIAGICNSKDKEVPENLKLCLFGIFSEHRFITRIIELKDAVEKIDSDKYIIVEQIKIFSAEEAQEYYDKFIAEGFEGAVMMDGSKNYKQGRVTINQHIGFKMKPHKETDLEIVGVTERFLNTNESHKNELGQSFKRNTVDNKESTEIAACFICKYKDTTTKVTITGDENFRREIWLNKDKYIGSYAVIKSMDYGEKNKLRHPRLSGIKSSVEK